LANSILALGRGGTFIPGGAFLRILTGLTIGNRFSRHANPLLATYRRRSAGVALETFLILFARSLAAGKILRDGRGQFAAPGASLDRIVLIGASPRAVEFSIGVVLKVSANRGLGDH
jgi:hypothetical protein